MGLERGLLFKNNVAFASGHTCMFLLRVVIGWVHYCGHADRYTLFFFVGKETLSYDVNVAS